MSFRANVLLLYALLCAVQSAKHLVCIAPLHVATPPSCVQQQQQQFLQVMPNPPLPGRYVWEVTYTHNTSKQQHTHPLQPRETHHIGSPTSQRAPPPSSPTQGAKPVPLLASVAIGAVLRFLIPCPAGITTEAWTLLAIFVSTIAGLVLSPLPVGAWAFLSATTAVATKTLPFSAAFSAFNNDVIWLIVVSFFFAKVRGCCVCVVCVYEDDQVVVFTYL